MAGSGWISIPQAAAPSPWRPSAAVRCSAGPGSARRTGGGFGAVAVLPTSAVELDAEAVRALCDADPAVGYLLAGRVLMAVADRLYSTRVRLLDVYGPPVRR